MKLPTAIFILFCATISCKNDANQAKTTYYLIRHAEKQTGKDPLLTEKGNERADFWARYFKDKEINAIYSTDTKRTLATARPTAQALDLKVNTYSANRMYNNSFKKETQGKTVLIVGHSNTTPEFVNKIINEKRYDHIKDSEFGTVFKVTVSSGHTNVEKETINSWDKP